MPRTPALAKLTRPRTHQAVQRERVFTVLDNARQRPLVWVSAPPGSGKTTLVASYVEARSLPGVWFQVDAGDSDPAAFFHYLTQGLRAGGKQRPALPQLAPEHLKNFAAFARRYFRSFFARLVPPAVLVLDNFQEAENALAQLLGHAVNEVPHGLNVVVISRTDPSSALSELDARGLLTLLGADNLALTLEETRAMSARRGVEDDGIVRAMHHQSAGWAAGVTLMLERLVRTGYRAGRMPADTREGVFNYFASLIFDQAPAAVQQTLLSLAYLPRMTATMANEISGNGDAGKLLESLHRRQLFTYRRDATEAVYELHALFQAFLQAQTHSEADEASRYRSRAAQYLQRYGFWEDAGALLLDASAWGDAARVIREHAHQLLALGRWNTLKSWIQRIPDTFRSHDPCLSYWLGCALAQTDPPQAVHAFEEAHRGFEASGDIQGRVLAMGGVLQACSIDHVDYATIDRHLEALAADLFAPGLHLQPEQELTVLGALAWGAFFVRPWHPCIGPALDRIESLLSIVQATSIALPAATSALTVASQTSQLERTVRLRERVERLATNEDAGPATVCWALFQVAHSYFLCADYASTESLFNRIWSIAKANELTRVLTSTLTHRFMIDFRLRDLAAAEASMRAIERLPAPTHPLSRGLLACYRARLSQVQGYQQAAAAYAIESDAEIRRTGAAVQEAIYGLINGEILLSAGRLEQARALLTRARQLILRAPLLCNLQPALLVVEAWYNELEGHGGEARRLLRDALTRSRRSNGWNQMRYVDSALVRMLPIAIGESIEPDQARWLTRTFRLRPPSPDIEEWPWPVRVRTLGDFAVQVDDLPLDVGRKAPRRVLGLLKALVAFGPREVPEQLLVDALWPDDEGDAGHKALSVTLLRLRRLLGDNELVRQHGGRLSLDPRRCWVDAWSFERRLTADSPDLQSLERTLALYRGAFLTDDADAPFTVAVRERIRGKFVHALGALGQRLEADGRHGEAIRWYLLGIEADPIIETFHQGLMRCYAALDRKTEAIAAYRRLRQTLSATLGLQPSATTERLYQTLR
jgi:DNA-binding SARP family transcriptional activator